MKDFTKARNSWTLRGTFLFFSRKKADTIHGISFLLISILLLPVQDSLAQAPILAGIEVTALNYNEGQASTPVTGTITVSDADSPLLVSATVQITNNYSSTEDLLQFANSLSITGSYNTTTGTLTLTGPATLADYTSALRSITYQNSNNDNPSNLVRTISFSTSDGVFTSLSVSRDVVVNAINDAPVGVPDFLSVDEDTSLDCGCFLENDTDAEGNTLVAIIVVQPTNGILLDVGGAFTYIPNPNFYGTDSFTYLANDGTANSGPTLVTITVRPINDAPIAVNDGITTDEDTSIAMPLLSNDTDVDDVLTVGMIVVVSPPAHGTVTINTTAGTVVYNPSLDYNGNDSFTYQVKDASGALSNIATVNIVIDAVNDAPVANPDNVTTQEETGISIPVLVNDIDVDNTLDASSLIIVNGPAKGSAVIQPSGLILYTPALDFTGNDSFTYQLKDASGALSNVATVTINVSPVNDDPIANPDLATTPEEIAVSIPVLANDTDVDNVLSAASLIIVSGPGHGSAVIQSTGTILYTPQKDFTGNDSFTYQVKDASGAFSNVVTVNIDVTPVNDAPSANPDLVTTPEEIAISIVVLTNDTDVDHALDPGSLNVASGPANGSAVVQPTGEILYTPRKDFTGTDSFTYTLKDPSNATSEATTVTVTVTPVNDTPVAVNDQATTEQNTLVHIDILSNDYDVDNEIIESSVTITSNPSHGVVSFSASTGMATFTPSTDYLGNDSFTYTIQDAEGLTSLPATVSIDVIEAPNRPPVAVDDGPIVNSVLSPITIDVLANDFDEDNNHDELSLVSVTAPSMGTVAIVNGKIIYQSGGLITGTVTFTYTIQDPSGLTDEAVVTIENFYPPLLVSEGFSPNNDANNETWYMQGIENYPNNAVKVFDRWGFLVYQKRRYENSTAPWDGRGNTAQHSGKLLDQGTYYYILEPGNEMKTMTGYVVIIR